jgi:RNA polymerase sigma-70 factor (ECF subfamily)
VSVKRDVLLVEAAQQGDLDGLTALYERYYRSMVALAYSVLADMHLAEDAAQQAFAIACRDLPKLKSKEKFAAWLAGICRNTAREIYRARGNHVGLQEQALAQGEHETARFRDAVRRAVWRLRTSEREVIVLRYYDNLAYEQIGSVLGISPQAVHGRLTRAKRKIASYLKRDGFKGGDYEAR